MRHKREPDARPTSGARSANGSARARTATTTARATSPIRCSSWRRPAAAPTPRTTPRRFSRACRTAARTSPSTCSPSAASRAAAIGASLFAGLAKLKARNRTTSAATSTPVDRYFEKRTQKFFEQDFLSPVIAAALFPDLLQRFLPIPVGPFDRSRALDASIEAAWARHDRGRGQGGHFRAKALPSPFESPFLDLWTPARADEAVPVADPQHHRGCQRLPHRHVADRHGRAAPTSSGRRSRACTRCCRTSKDASIEPDIKLSTAAGMSARFPWVLPAATVETGPERKPMRLVDGGYVESSGVDSASQLLKALKVAVDRTKDTPDAINAKFYLVVLMGYEGTARRGPQLRRAAAAAAHPDQHLANSCRDRVPRRLRRCVPRDRHLPRQGAAETSYRRALVELPVIPVFLNLRDFQHPADLAAHAGEPRDHRAARRQRRSAASATTR